MKRLAAVPRDGFDTLKMPTAAEYFAATMDEWVRYFEQLDPYKLYENDPTSFHFMVAFILITIAIRLPG